MVAIGFAVQENVEHLVSHDHLLGLGALIGPEYPLALPVIATITLVAGLVAAGYVAAERRLVAGIHDALRRLERPPRRLARAPLRLHVRRSSPLAFAVAGRGPPLRLLDVLS